MDDNALRRSARVREASGLDAGESAPPPPPPPPPAPVAPVPAAPAAVAPPPPAALVSLPLRYPRPPAGKSVELWVALDARPAELRAVLAAALKVPEGDVKLLRRDEAGKLLPCALSAGLLLSQAHALLLDAGAPPKPPSCWRAHAPQLAGLACLSALVVAPAPASAFLLLPLSLASAALTPGPPGLLSRAGATAAPLLSAFVLSTVQASVLPPLLAALGMLAAVLVSALRLRLLLLSIFVMLTQAVLARATGWEQRLRKGGAASAPAKPPAAAAPHK